jgi:flagellar biosynthesis anti-sigma factor FlgM
MKVDPRAISAYQNTVNLSERAGRVKGNGAVEAGKSKGATSSVRGAEDARVTISPEARQLAAGSAVQASSGAEASGVDAAKVAALKEKVANGSLQIDSHVIAQRMVDRTG